MKRALLILVCLVLLLPSCRKKVDQRERVKQAVRDTAAAVEAGDIRAFMGFISEDYSDNRGFDRNTVKGVVFAELMRPGRLRVYMRELDVPELEGEKAVVEGRVFVARFDRDEDAIDIIPEDAQGFRFSIVMRREDGRWRALVASWETVGPVGLI